MKVINIIIKETDGIIDFQLDNLSREDKTELEEVISDGIENIVMQYTNMIAKPMLKKTIIDKDGKHNEVKLN